MATGRFPTTANSPLTAKGDIFTYSTGSAKLAVGNDGESVVADSSTSTGLRYTAGNPISNPVLNSAFQIWQRTTSLAFTGGAINYVADRWQAWATAAGTSISVSRQNTSDTTNLPFIQYCTRFQRVAANTSTAVLVYQTTFETINSIPFAGKPVTFSFYARKGANYTASDVLPANLIQGTGTDQNVNGFTAGTTVAGLNATLTTTWQRFTVTGTVNAASTQLGIQFSYTPTGTAGANDYYEVTGVQVDIGSVALPFRTYAVTIQGELAACQRYYQRINGDTTDSSIVVMGTAYSTVRAFMQWVLPVSLRTKPTVGYSTSTYPQIANYQFTATSLTSAAYYSNGNNMSLINLDVRVASGLTANTTYTFIMNTSNSQYIDASAEL